MNSFELFINNVDLDIFILAEMITFQSNNVYGLMNKFVIDVTVTRRLIWVSIA